MKLCPAPNIIKTDVDSLPEILLSISVSFSSKEERSSFAFSSTEKRSPSCLIVSFKPS